MTDTTTYTATITITSIGDDNSITVDVGTDPSAVQRITEGKGLPAAYEAARDIQRFVNMTTTSRRSFNMTDRELDKLDEEGRMAAIREAAESARYTMLATRRTTNVK